MQIDALAVLVAIAGCSDVGGDTAASSTDGSGADAGTTGGIDDATDNGSSPATGTDPSGNADGTSEGADAATTDTTAASTGPDGGTPGCGSPLDVGATTETIDVDGVERTYLVVVPPSLDADTPAPVLLGFHGGNGTSEYASEVYGLAGDEAALYVYPQAPYWKEAGGIAWDVDPAGVDFPYFDALLVDLGEKYCVDVDRVFAAGQSNGGFFVNALGCYRPEALRAIAPVAGGGPPGECTPSTLAVMIVHGTLDMTVPIDSGMYARDYWFVSNGCTETSAPIEPAPCISYSDCAEPVLWCEHAGGHDWPAFAGAGIRGFFLGL